MIYDLAYFCNCCLKFAAVTVWPLYGPLVGGTRVTISVQSLNVSAIRSVTFRWDKRFRDTSKLVCPLFYFNDSCYDFFVICDLFLKYIFFRIYCY